MRLVGMFNVLELSDAAVARVKEIVATSGENPIGIRVGIKKGGCAGMEYAIDLVQEANAKDDKIEKNGATVFVDPAATLFLLGTKMGYEEGKLNSGFTFDNPNQTSACGCGESVELAPAKLPEKIGVQ